jgi:ankyrin repeat protein
MKKKNYNFENNLAFDNQKIGWSFLTYLERRLDNKDLAWQKAEELPFKDEFFVTCLWIQHYAKTKLNTEISVEEAATMVNLDKASSFSKKISDKFFDGFMHYVAASNIPFTVVDSLMKNWLSDGRSLTELDHNGLTPLQVATYTNNSSTFRALIANRVKATTIDQDGLTPLHVIINKINDGSGDISFLKEWIEAKLPTNMKSSKKHIYPNKTAVEFAEFYGLIEATKLLGGDIDTAKICLNFRYQTDKLPILQKYDLMIYTDSKLQKIVESEKYKLLLHYIVDSFNNISPKLFAEFLDDRKLNLNTDISFNGGTILQKCIEHKFDNLALELIKRGIGSSTLDNGFNALNYCVFFNNYDLLNRMISDPSIEILKFKSPEKYHTISKKEAITFTPLLQAVINGEIQFVIKLAQAGFGTSKFLDNTNHVLSYVNIFGKDKKTEMVKALKNSGVDLSGDKPQQVLVNALYPKIQANFAKSLIESGIKTDEVIKFFASQKLLRQIKFLISNGAKVATEIKETIKDEKIKQYLSKIEETDNIESQSTIPMTHSEKLKFILLHLANNNSPLKMVLNYKGADGISKKYLEIFEHFQKVKNDKPKTFSNLCKYFKVTVSQEDKMNISNLVNESLFSTFRENEKEATILGKTENDETEE